MTSNGDGYPRENGEDYDYIIIGSGPAGTVVASRLNERDPSLSILLIEAGEDESQKANVSSPLAAARLLRSEVDWNYETVPQQHLDNRSLQAAGGKALGGGSVTNFGLWVRGDAKDYDSWAELVGDRRWSYNGLLPYFRKTEKYHTRDVDAQQHGFDGPVNTASPTSTGRKYILRDPIKSAWAALGVHQISDINNGAPLGLGEVVEARKDSARLIASSVYPLHGVQIMLSTLVERVLIEKLNGKETAVGIKLMNGKRYYVKREVIVSTGAVRTPQLLMLSGIGPAAELTRHGINVLIETPSVGQNLWDHLGTKQLWKLKHPEDGASVGSPMWKDPAYPSGNPVDWFAFDTVPKDCLRAALAEDEGTVAEPSLLVSPRCHICTYVQYIGFNPVEPLIPMDGSHITTNVLIMLPTSRGSIRLGSADPNISPVIDFNYYATEVDRMRMREGIRRLVAMLCDTDKGKTIVESETVAKRHKPLCSSSTDEEIDIRVRELSSSIYHPAGTAAMGKVVDVDLRVIGVENLRVVDASVLPVRISAPLQACVYALAEQAADLLMK